MQVTFTLYRLRLRIMLSLHTPPFHILLYTFKIEMSGSSSYIPKTRGPNFC